MAASAKIVKPTNCILVKGTPRVTEKQIEDGTNMYSGRLVKLGSTTEEIVVGTATDPVYGVLGYEQTVGHFMPTSVDTIYSTLDKAGVMGTFGETAFTWVGSLAPGSTVSAGDELIAWTNGELAKGFGAGVYTIVEYVWSNVDGSEVTTNLTIPAGLSVVDGYINVTLAESGKFMTVGLTTTDVDGFMIAMDVGSVAKVWPGVTISGSTEDYMSATQYGELLCDFTAGSDAVEDVGTYVRKNYPVTTAKTLSYNTDGTVGTAGSIFLVCEGLTGVVAVAEEAGVDAAGSADIMATWVKR